MTTTRLDALIHADGAKCIGDKCTWKENGHHLRATTFFVDDRTILAVETTRGYGSEPLWDLFEDEERLTPADPLFFDGLPTTLGVETVLHPRVQALMGLMAEYEIRQCNDYPDFDDDVIAATEGTLPGRYAYIHGDETYSFIGTSATAQDAADAMAGHIGQECGGNPVAIIDLDTGEEIKFESSVRIIGAPPVDDVVIRLTREQAEALGSALDSAERGREDFEYCASLGDYDHEDKREARRWHEREIAVAALVRERITRIA